MPKDVASSVFHGSWPTRPSTTQAPHSRNSPNCFNARYGPAGLSVESPPAMDACGARRAVGFSGKSRIVVKRAPLKKKAAEAAFSIRGTGAGWRLHCRAFPRRQCQAFAAADFAACALADFAAGFAAGLATAGLAAMGCAGLAA